MKRYSALLLSLVLILSLLVGCGGKAASGSQPAPAQTPEQAAEPVQEPAGGEQPPAEPAVEEPVTLTWFTSLLNPSQQVYLPTMADNHVFQAIEEKMGVTLEPKEISSETYGEQVNIMVASGDCTDLVFNALDFVANPELMLTDEVFVELTELIDTCMPNYKQLLQSDENFAKEASTSSGSIAGIYEYVAEPEGYTLGLLVRSDWLEELNMQVPVTYADWEEMLKAFLVEKEASMPFGVQQSGIPVNNTFSAGYGVALGAGFVTFQETGLPFYQVDGQVKCGYLESGFTDFITMMHNWYSAGLIGQDFLTREMPDACLDDVRSGQTGAYYFFKGAFDGLPFMAAPSVAVSSPVVKEGDTLHIGGYLSKVGEYHNVISTNCEHPEKAAQLLDYLYSEEGAVLTNFGVEGLSMEYQSGKPVFTEVVTKSPEVTGDENYSTENALEVYTLRRLGGRYDSTRMNSTYSEAYAGLTGVWYGNRDGAYDIPDYVVLTQEQNEAFNGKWTDLQTLILENVSKFITGEKPLAEIKDFQNALRGMGIEDCVSIYQQACDAA